MKIKGSTKHPKYRHYIVKVK